MILGSGYSLGRRLRNRVFAVLALVLAGEGAATAVQTAWAQASIPAPSPSEPAPGPTFFNGEQLELGSPLAPITVVEYLSTTCSHCAAFERDTWPAVEREYVATGKVRFIVREMPTAPVAVAAAGFLLARCAGKDRYWVVVQALLKGQQELLGAASLSAAVTRERDIAKLDPDMAEACLTDPIAIDAVNARRQAGLAAGVDSTPYFIVNGWPLRPGARLSGERYDGGELSLRQFASAVAVSRRRSSGLH